MLQVRTSVVAGANGSRKAVVGSGTTSMSLSWISWKPRIDHLDLLVRDRLEDIFDCDTIRNHGFTPATESGTLNVTLPSGALQSRPGGSGRSTPHLRDAVAPASSGMAMLA